MKLYEYEGKELFRQAGIPVPAGIFMGTPDDEIPLPCPVVLKAQVLAGGRGKAGAIRVALDEMQARAEIRSLLEAPVNGSKVKGVLAEEKVSIAKELYASFSVDRQAGGVLLMTSAHGGMDIEATEQGNISLVRINPLLGLQSYMIRQAGRSLGLTKQQSQEFGDILRSLYGVFVSYHCELAEINPLAVTVDGHLKALDAKVVIDDRAQSMFPQYANRQTEGLTDAERKFSEMGIFAAEMEGDIAVVTAGAGVAMATADALDSQGGTLRVIIDIGGIVGHEVELCTEAFEIVRDLRPKVILFNFFMQVTRLDGIAEAINRVLRYQPFDGKVVVRMKGFFGREGLSLLNGAGFELTDSFSQACTLALRAARG